MAREHTNEKKWAASRVGIRGLAVSRSWEPVVVALNFFETVGHVKDKNMIPRQQVTNVLVCLGAACFFAIGCGRKGPDVQFVTGVVTLDGAPLEGAMVAFSPRDGQGLGAVGTTQSDGRFTLNAAASRPGSGTTRGEYVVLIEKSEYAEYPDIPQDDPRYGTPEYERLIAIADATPPKFITPRRYADVETSPFTAVVESGTNEYVFDLISDEK